MEEFIRERRIVIPRILKENIPNSKTNSRPKVEQIKRVMVETVTEVELRFFTFYQTLIVKSK